MGLLAGMVRKDLLRHARSPLGPALVLAFPLIFAGLIALTFGGSSGTPKVRLLVENRDDGLASQLALAALRDARMTAYFDVEEVGVDLGLARIERDEASALLRIPNGFTDAILAREPVTLELVRNPSERILPEIAEQVMAVGVEVLDAGARVLGPGLDGLRGAIEGDGWPTPGTVAAIATAVQSSAQAASTLVFPPVIALEVVAAAGNEPEEQGSTFSIVFLTMLPGVAVWALFMVGDTGMRDILTEATAGTLRRQLAAPLGVREIVAGKALAMAALALISLTILAGIGAFAARRPVDAGAFLALSAALVLAVTGFSAVVYGLARTERQGSTLASIVLLVFAFLGGAFVPLDSLPASLRIVSRLTPIAWGTMGYQSLLEDGAGLSGVLPSVLVLAGFGASFLVVGMWLLGRKAARGVVA